MKWIAFMVIFLGLLTGGSVAVAGEPVGPPDWSGEPYHTHQSWDFLDTGTDPGTGDPIPPEIPYQPDSDLPWHNPYGTPELVETKGESDNPDYWGWSDYGMGMENQDYYGLYGGMCNGYVEFEIPNSAQEDLIKNLWLQYVVYIPRGGPGPDGAAVTTIWTDDDPDGETATRTSKTWEQLDGPGSSGWWWRITEEWEIFPVPGKEYLKIYGSTEGGPAVLIDEAHIYTRCVPLENTAVVATSPVEDAQNVKVNTPISITFNKVMDTGSVENALTVEPALQSYDFEWSDNEKTVTFTYEEAYLQLNSVYTVTISTDAKDTLGFHLVDPYSFSFTTEAYVQPDPQVSEPDPATDEPSITVSGAGVYRYRHKLDEGEWKGPFELSESIELSGLSDGEHTLYVQVEDAEMSWHDADPVIWTVMAPPKVVSTVPGDNQRAPASARISVSFNEAMNEQSVESAFSIEPPMSGAFRWSGNTLTFAPDESLTADITYTVTIDASASDVAGNSMVSLYSWSFSTYAVAEIRCSDVADTYVLMGGMGGVGYPTRDRLMAAACPMVDARILVKFDLSGLDGVDAEQISKAELCYYMIDRVEGKSMEMEPTAPAGTPMYGFIYVLDNTWSEAEPGTPGYTDWNTKPGYATGAPMVLATHSSGNYSSGSIDVTEIVKGWVRGDYENNGIELKDHDDRCYVDLEHDEGFPWYWASRERDGGQSAPYLSVEIQADCLRITDKPAALPDLSFGETITFEAEGGNGSYAWQVTGPEGGDVTDQTLSEKSGSTTVFTAPGTAGIYRITVTDGIDSDSIFVGVRDPDSYTPPQELYDLSQELFPLFMGGQISADDQQGIYGICEKIVSDIGSSGMLREITVINGGPESLVGGTGKSYGASAAIAIIDNPHQASQEVGVVDQNGNTVCKIAITAGDIDAQAGNKIYAVATETGISSWSGASGVYSFALYREDGQKLDNALISNLAITMSFDKNLIVSDELRDGAYSIVFTEGTAQFFTADEEDPKSSVPVSDINEVNNDEGWVQFRVDHLTTFGMGNSSAGAAMTGSKSDEVGGLGGCFITTAGYPDFGK